MDQGPTDQGCMDGLVDDALSVQAIRKWRSTDFINEFKIHVTVKNPNIGGDDDTIISRSYL